MGFTDEERAAMKERAEETKPRRGRGKKNEEAAVLAKIQEMPEPDRAMAERIHALVTAGAPELSPKLWYGMPAYAKDGKVICFFQAASKFKTRYATLGFDENATLDDGAMWPTVFAITKLGADEEARITELIEKAVR